MKRLCSVLALTAITLHLIAVNVLAQTESELDRQYPSIKAYVVRPTILMTVRFDRDARACEIELQPLRRTVLVENLSQEETIRVVEEVVPKGDRGGRSEGRGWSKWLKSDISGNSITTTYPYELMTLTFMGTVQDGENMVATVTWKQRACAR